MNEVRLGPNNLQFITFGRPLPNIPVTWSVSPRFKYRHSGTFRFEMHKNSYRYGPELILTLESLVYPHELEARAPNNGVWRMEVCIPLREVYNALMEALPEMHARLNGIMK